MWLAPWSSASLGADGFSVALPLKTPKWRPKQQWVQALAPICAAKFEEAANAENGMVAKFAAVDSWKRDSHLMEAGWATFPGGAKPDNNVAEACAELLNTALKIK